MSMIRKNILVVCVFILIQFHAFTQEQISDSQVERRYDSLVHLYNHVHLEPTYQRSELIKLLAVNSFGGRNSLNDRIDYLKDGISILEKWDSTKLLVYAYNKLGRLHWLNGDPNKSIQSVYKVVELAKAIGDMYWEGNAYANLGVSYKMQGDFRKALPLERQSLVLFQKQSDTIQIFNIYSSISETYYQLKQYDSARLSVSKALTFNIVPENPSFQFINAILQGTQAKLVARDGNYDSASLLINASAKILGTVKSSELDQQTALNSIELGQIFLEYGKIDEAIEFAAKGYEIGIDHGLKEVIREGASVLAQAYEAKNQLEKSINFYKIYYAYRDSIVNVENVKQVESLRADFEINQKQTELDIVEVRRKNQELVSFITAGILLVILVLALLVYRSYRQKLALSKELAIINDSKNKLFSIISHDLRGPMAAFSGVGFMIKSALDSEDKSFLEEVATEVDKSSKQLSSLLENLLSWAMQEQNGLIVHHEKLSTVEVFSELKETFESQAKVKNIEIEIGGVNASQVSADRNMTYTIFRNLISNALKFTPENGKITISSSVENDFVQTKISDTGVGMPQEKVNAIFQFDSKKSTYGTAGEKGLGLGLQLVSEFVETNGGSIHVESEEGKGTTFIVKLPLFEE